MFYINYTKDKLVQYNHLKPTPLTHHMVQFHNPFQI